MRDWRWRIRLAVALCALLPASALLAAPPLPAPDAATLSRQDRSDIQIYVRTESTKLRSATTMHDRLRATGRLLAPIDSAKHPASATFRYRYGRAVNQSCLKLLNDPKAAFYAAMVAARMRDISVEHALEAGLKNANPAVRYWSAKGLGDILNGLYAIHPAYRRAVAQIAAALKKETQAIVFQRLADALVRPKHMSHRAPAILTDALSRLAARYAAKPPQNLPVALALVRDETLALAKFPKLSAKRTTRLASALTNLMSFTAQWNQAGRIPALQKASAMRVVFSSAILLNHLGHTARMAMRLYKAKTNPGVVLLAVNGITGSNGTPGRVQSVFKAVPVPHRINQKHLQPKTPSAVGPASAPEGARTRSGSRGGRNRRVPSRMR